MATDFDLRRSTLRDCKSMVFELSEEELIQVDLFEVDDYSRKKGLTKSGTEVWIYIANTNNEKKRLSSFF